MYFFEGDMANTPGNPILNARQQLVKTIHIDFFSSIENVRYSGDFVIRKLSIRDMAALGVRKAQLNGGMYFNREALGRGVDADTDNFNNMIAHLELAVKKSPSWWDLDQLSDVDLIAAVYREVLEFESSFLRRNSEGENDNRPSTDGSEADVQETNTSRTPRKVVGKEVLSALEP